MIHSTFVLLSLFGAVYGQLNDWSKPCLSGVCFYDLPSSSGSEASGTLQITGSADSITDITTAAGWEILDCQKDALSQDIRLVCTGGESDCDHLYQSIGAVGKIARLPERCGENAFAHISRAWIPEDQSIPEHIARRLVRRDGVQPEVKALHIDTNFAAADTSQIGTVSFTIQAANVPGAAASVPPSSLGAREKRQFGFIKKAVAAVTELNDISLDKSITLPALNVDKTFNVFDQELSCPPLDARLKLDVAAKAHAVAAIGVAAEGTIVPPKIDDFAITATLNADLNGAVHLTGGLTGSIDSGKINVFQVGIPGLDFPGILTVGPSFTVDVQANADLDVSADVTVGINYKIDKASLVFPPSSDKAQAQGGSFKLNDTPLKLSVSPSLKATGTLEAHLIPSLNLGIEALGGVAEATVFLELDASAAMRLSLEGQAEAAVTVNRTSSRSSSKNAIGNIREFAESSSSPNRVVGRAIAMRQAQAVASSTTDSGVSVTPSAGASFGGCFEILAGLAVNAGARAEFFGLFDEETVVPLFNRDFELFKRCFGAQPSARRRSFRFARSDEFSARSVPEPVRLMKRLECPAEDAPPAEPLVDQIVSAASAIQLP